MSECTWIKFYESLANKLVEYKGDRKQLIEVIKKAHKEVGKDLSSMCNNKGECSLEREKWRHHCPTTVEITQYKKSIRESKFSSKEIAMILDFYITRNFAAKTGLAISLEQYGWEKYGNGQYAFSEIEKALLEKAEIDGIRYIRAKTINDNLNLMQLSGNNICIEHPRIILMQDFSANIDENENLKIESKENKINCLFRHIRNSLAHGNTFFFDNGNVLLEDKDKEKITARILIKQKTLKDWISVIDKERLIYVD